MKEELVHKCSNSIPTSLLTDLGSDLIEDIKKTLYFCEKNWPSHLPKGFIHADMFPDNVFFKIKKFQELLIFISAVLTF